MKMSIWRVSQTPHQVQQGTREVLPLPCNAWMSREQQRRGGLNSSPRRTKSHWHDVRGRTSETARVNNTGKTQSFTMIVILFPFGSTWAARKDHESRCENKVKKKNDMHVQQTTPNSWVSYQLGPSKVPEPPSGNTRPSLRTSSMRQRGGVSQRTRPTQSCQKCHEKSKSARENSTSLGLGGR